MLWTVVCWHAVNQPLCVLQQCVDMLWTVVCWHAVDQPLCVLQQCVDMLLTNHGVFCSSVLTCCEPWCVLQQSITTLLWIFVRFLFRSIYQSQEWDPIPISHNAADKWLAVNLRVLQHQPIITLLTCHEPFCVMQHLPFTTLLTCHEPLCVLHYLPITVQLTYPEPLYVFVFAVYLLVSYMCAKIRVWSCLVTGNWFIYWNCCM